ncbi:MAG TPA: DUF3108 domain-containing protein [Thermoanaerobaculia bacterium]|nr:DUF3108 domain-containing protein [Thermoanaerobaculia bacterium]
MNRHCKIALAAALGLLLVTPSAGLPQAPPPNEEFQYRWQLRNFMGNLAGLFLPNQGEGLLTFKSDKNGRLRSELTITSSSSRNGEYFRYGSEVDTRTLQPIRAWSAYSWRGETKSKSSEIDQNGVLDIASGIYSIRQDPPTKARRMEIWSDGKVYPVVVMPLGTQARKLRDGKKIDVRHYSIRGIDVPGRRKWKGKLDLWLARDAAATPVEIVISRNLADVHMELKSLP